MTQTQYLDRSWGELAPLLKALPAERLAAAEAACKAPNRTLLVADETGDFLLAVGRPSTAYFKLLEESPANEDESRVRLLTHLAEAARKAGAALLKGPADLAGRKGFRSWVPPRGAVGGPTQASVFALDARGEALLAAPRRAYFQQTTGFTCGPSSLQMALAKGEVGELSRSHELALWREATFMVGKEGPGGCDPFGVALAAGKRGLKPKLVMTSDEPLFLQRARTDELRDLMIFVQGDFRDKAKAAGIPIEFRSYAAEELGRVIDAGGQVILLVDEFPMHGWHTPHWIVLHAHHDGLFLAHDPWTETGYGESWLDSSDLPLTADQVMTIGAWGEAPYRVAILLDRPS